jgi:hypothetical protein
MVQQVMVSFTEMYKEAMTREQRNLMIHILINEITSSESREIDSIQIQFSNEVLRHFTITGGRVHLMMMNSPPFFYEGGTKNVVYLLQEKKGNTHNFFVVFLLSSYK